MIKALAELRAAARAYLETQKLASVHGDSERHGMLWWQRAWIALMILLVLLTGVKLWIQAHTPSLTVNVYSSPGKSTLP